MPQTRLKPGATATSQNRRPGAGGGDGSALVATGFPGIANADGSTSKTLVTGPWSLVPNSRATVARHRLVRNPLAGENVVEPPADVALTHVAPGRPPGEQVVVVRVERAPDVHQTPADEALDEGALFRQLPDGARLAFLRMDVPLGPRHVQIAAQDQRARSAARKLSANASSASRNFIFAGKSLPPFGT